ncbi:MAG TPA: DUF3276 family protein [Tepidisphaeraceae bacterium]|jgi:hypothetical protein
MPAAAKPAPKAAPRKGAPKSSFDDHPILFQKFFKSVGPRTYVAQVKETTGGNQYLVLTEGKRSADSGEVKKIRLFVYSEDFPEFFRMLHETAHWIKDHPMSAEAKKKRDEYWKKSGMKKG